jgi:hypothetical protein
MVRFLVIAAVLTALASCKDKKSGGLPPAPEWNASTGDMPAVPGAAIGNNPHAQGSPHAQANPHGGSDQPAMPPGHPPIDNPHGGGTDVSKLGIPPPDPNRKINPNNRVKGVIKIHPKAKDRVAAGGAVFIVVKRSVDGAPSGMPLAVDKLEWGNGDLPFEVGEKQAMSAGTELTGEVVVTARYDQDGDAISKQPGDVSGSVRVKIPADKVTLTLDDVLQ